MSEPPAHDDWQPKAAQALTPHQRTYVTVALDGYGNGSAPFQGATSAREVCLVVKPAFSCCPSRGHRALLDRCRPGGADGSRPSGSSGTGGRKAALRLGCRCRKEQASATVSLLHASGSVSLARVIPARQSPSHHGYRWMRGPEILSLRTESHPR